MKSQDVPGRHSKPTSQVIAEIVPLMRQAENYRRLNNIDAFYEIRRRVIALAVPLLQRTVSIGSDTTTLISALSELGSRPRAINALVEAAQALEATDCGTAEAIRRLIDETRNGPIMADGKQRDVCWFYACQACGRLQGWLGTGCPSCGFLPQTPLELAISSRISHPLQDLGHIVAIAQRIKAGEKFGDFVKNLDVLMAKFMADPVWPTYLAQLERDQKEQGVDWLLTLPEVSCCPGCQTALEYSSDETCRRCGQGLNFPPMQRALIAADRLIALIEDFIHINPTDEAKQMVSSLVYMRDKAFFYQQIPSAEDMLVFRNYWDKEVDLWHWDEKFTFRVQDGKLVGSHHYGAPDGFKDAEAARFVRELGLFSRWLYHEVAIT